ncbi:MAG: hypothetical protein AVDCRST_MAG93-3659 [uncultured Chloroflexia bacterium]|uniref:Uncharacterized protein n=1 Tax=uncultured Chloroflexia bacterium TaxID=1672391 RepID=A0A6J4JUI4_9CHLR|nr:MAG: hypothetical protein AVDCRST_MAG93-3659 [uncultured Chloroflexia bacterium]
MRSTGLEKFVHFRRLTGEVDETLLGRSRAGKASPPGAHDGPLSV